MGHRVSASGRKIRRSDPASGARVLVGDCRDLIPGIAGPLDLIFADPPFNIGVDYGDGGDGDSMSAGAYRDFTADWVGLCAGKLRPGGSLFVHVGDGCVYDVLAAADAAGLERVNWIIWHYRFGQYTAARFIPSKAHLFWLVRPPLSERTWNLKEAQEDSVRLKMGDKRVGDSPHGGRRPMCDVWYGPLLGRVQGNNRERRPLHPNQLPEMYLSRVIRVASNPGDRVLDPFTGSGTTGTVAVSLGRDFIGIERNPDFAASAIARIRAGAVRDVRHG